jgi:hypothetical protein
MHKTVSAYNRQDERVSSTLAGENGVPKRISNDFTEEVEVVVDLTGFLQQRCQWIKLEIHVQGKLIWCKLSL